jgi:hypothetical protein
VIDPIQRQFRFWQLLPFFGCVLFLLLYIIATLNYPGGTNLDKSSIGFSWAQNYWCNLLNENAINGKHNVARPIALTGMAVISLSLTAFWYLFPLRVNCTKTERYVIQASGLLAMLTGVFIFTRFHDSVINVAGMFGLIALVGTLRGLKKSGWMKLFYAGLILLFLIGLNNLLYHKKDLMYYLPVVQKITFLYFLVWICCINLRWLGKATDLSFVK